MLYGFYIVGDITDVSVKFIKQLWQRKQLQPRSAL